MTINLFDDGSWSSLRPLTYTRPVADLRIGILTIAEKWARYARTVPGYITAEYLSAKYPVNAEGDFFVNGSICPDPELFREISALQEEEVLMQDAVVIAFRSHSFQSAVPVITDHLSQISYSRPVTRIVYPEDIFRNNDQQLRADFDLLTHGRTSAAISSTNTILGSQFFAEEGAVAECSTFNTLQGPVYLGKDTQVWEGTHIRGSFALCDHSQVKMGSKIYGQTTIGPFSRVGGEINNAVIWGCSSKGHEGYLGNAVVGQWCNFGADSNNSNLKNNYAEVKLWDYQQDRYRNTGLQFCGLIMADHAKCGINTMFNTGTVAGVGANIFGPGYPPNFIPDFSWGGAQKMETYQLDKFFETTVRVFERKNAVLDHIEKNILSTIFRFTEIYRRF